MTTNQIPHWVRDVNHPVQWYDFTTWVEKQDDDAIVGTSYSTSDCPVSNYVKERHPDLSPVHITPLATYHIPDGDRAGQRRWSNPSWLAAIILQVDAIGLDVPISGRQLKQCLATSPFSQPSPDQSGNNTWGQLAEEDEGGRQMKIYKIIGGDLLAFIFWLALLTLTSPDSFIRIWFGVEALVVIGTVIRVARHKIQESQEKAD